MDFLNENIWISIEVSLKFVPRGPISSIPALVQIMAWRRPGDKPLSEPVMARLLTHICVTQPQWVNLSIHRTIDHRFCDCCYPGGLIGITTQAQYHYFQTLRLALESQLPEEICMVLWNQSDQCFNWQRTYYVMGKLCEDYGNILQKFDWCARP